MDDKLILGGHEFASRLLVGTGKYGTNKIIPEVIDASGSEIITMALRRVDLGNKNENILTHIPEGITILPNTSGATNADEAVRIARISRKMGCGDFIKIEVISDTRYLLPDNEETIKATEILAKEGFVVLPYMTPDLYAGRRLIEAGAAAVMPLGAPIGSNRGLQMKEMIRIMISELDIPIIVDAGIGKPSQAMEAMEMGASAVLVNTAIASAGDHVEMAMAFRLAVEGGRSAYLAQTGAVSEFANASSPLTGFLGELELSK
ncbi:MAG: thiazole synthase [Clostridioides sp.]|jgi:thiazole synthase|nr:thiazole synthase [Clostridioides sp.]